MELKVSFLGLLGMVAIASCTSTGFTSGCSKYCPHGQVLDVFKCRCELDRVLVNPIHRCPQLNCVAGPFPCKGYTKDARGCNTCHCLDNCFRSRCPRACRGGTENYLDAAGCTACRCKQYPVCNNHVRCVVHCPLGYVRDINGCDTCQCKPALCGSVCKLFCPYGQVINSNGCELCKCKPKPLCGRVCTNTCIHDRVLDSYGCPSCKCLSG